MEDDAEVAPPAWEWEEWEWEWEWEWWEWWEWDDSPIPPRQQSKTNCQKTYTQVTNNQKQIWKREQR